MRLVIFIFAVGVIITYLLNKFSNWRIKKSYTNAGRKWDNIVDDLRKRK